MAEPRIYLVGGAVRDRLLNRQPRERDWVVVGGSARHMKDAGYLPVGKDFPVFLHPQTREEYALARTERKTAPGYHGFDFHTAPEVTLEQDLQRRDLTINAMAMDDEGNLIDPWGGQQDLEAGLLRHVSTAFGEDPVRILRTARFAARLAPLQFRVAPETLTLMREMVEAGEVDALVADRVWQETQRALDESQPAVFFQVLAGCGALDRLYPELAGDALGPALACLEQAVRLDAGTPERFAALMQALPDPVAAIDAMAQRLPVPRAFRELAELAGRLCPRCHEAGQMDAEHLLAWLEQADALRRPERLAGLLTVCHADYRARHNHTGTHRPWPPAERLEQALAAATRVDTAAIAHRAGKGPEIAEAIRAARRAAIALAIGEQ